jgi:hypothetical protein
MCVVRHTDAATCGSATQAVAINAQQLARSPDALPLLLGLLEGGPADMPDFYVRYHTLQVLKGLAAAAPRQLQDVSWGLQLRTVAEVLFRYSQAAVDLELLLLGPPCSKGTRDMAVVRSRSPRAGP